MVQVDDIHGVVTNWGPHTCLCAVAATAIAIAITNIDHILLKSEACVQPLTEVKLFLYYVALQNVYGTQANYTAHLLC